MPPLALVITVCTALSGSPYRDHCDDIRVPMFGNLLPTSCVAKAQEYISSHPDRFEDATIVSFGCVRRDRPSAAEPS